MSNAQSAFPGDVSFDIGKTLMWGREGNYQILLTVTSQKVIDAVTEAAERNGVYP
jgi:peptidyl-tRNA hydrolase